MAKINDDSRLADWRELIKEFDKFNLLLSSFVEVDGPRRYYSAEGMTTAKMRQILSSHSFFVWWKIVRLRSYADGEFNKYRRWIGDGGYDFTQTPEGREFLKQVDLLKCRYKEIP